MVSTQLGSTTTTWETPLLQCPTWGTTMLAKAQDAQTVTNSTTTTMQCGLVISMATTVLRPPLQVTRPKLVSHATVTTIKEELFTDLTETSFFVPTTDTQQSTFHSPEILLLVMLEEFNMIQRMLVQARVAGGLTSSSFSRAGQPIQQLA